jgi:hypothetical protein
MEICKLILKQNRGYAKNILDISFVHTFIW